MAHHAEVIKLLRLKRGWSQAQLAERTGIQQPVIANHETGKAKPSARLMMKYAEAFGLTYPDFELQCEGGLTERNRIMHGVQAAASDDPALRNKWIDLIVAHCSTLPLPAVHRILTHAAAEHEQHERFKVDAEAQTGKRVLHAEEDRSEGPEERPPAPASTRRRR